MRGLLAAFSLVFLGLLLLMTPMRMALGWLDAEAAGLSARSVEGTVWAGKLQDAAFRGAPLGDADVALDLGSLLGLSPGVRVSSSGPVKGSALVQSRGASTRLEVEQATAPIALIAPGLPLHGDLHLKDFELDSSGGRCQHASGLVTIRGAAAAQADLRLTGQAGCREGVLIVPLSGRASGASVRAQLSISPRGAWRLDSAVETPGGPTVSRTDEGWLGRAG